MKKFLRKLRSIFFKNYPRTFLTIYLVFALVGGFLLWLPFSKVQPLSFLDSLFVSVSAMSTTGLSPVSLTNTFSLVGKIIVIIIMQVGGLGIYMLIANFWILSGRKIGISERAMLAQEQNLFSLKGIIRNMKHVFLTIMSIQLVSFIFLSLYFYFTKTFGDISIGESILQGVFMTTALFMNAGFDIYTGGFVFANFLASGQHVIIIWSMILIFIGGVGFIPISETIDLIISKFKKTEFKYSYVAKLLFWTHLGIFIFGGFVLYFMEMNGVLKGQGFINGMSTSFFTSISARSAGFNIYTNLKNLQPATQFFMVILMFIGASPNSAGGGIRITTAILAISGVIRFGLNKSQTKIGRRAYKENTVQKATVALLTAILLIIIAVLIVTIREGNTVFESTYEIVSAFGTVGYTNGLTAKASILTKLVLIFIMFVGRISVITLISVVDLQKKEQGYLLTEFDLMVS